METIDVTVVGALQLPSGWSKVTVREMVAGRALNVFKAVGKGIPAVEPGDYLKIKGEWQDDAKWGRQFQVSFAHKSLPTTPAGLMKELARHVPQFGPIKAQRISEYFGYDIFEVLTGGWQRLAEVPGISLKLAQSIHQSYLVIKDEARSNLRIWLSDRGIESVWIDRIIDQFGVEKTKSRLEMDPWSLDQVPGIGFKIADEFAKKMSFPVPCLPRTRGVIRHLIHKAMQQGHTALHEGELIDASLEKAGVSAEQCREGLEQMVGWGWLVRDLLPLEYGGHRCMIYLPKFYEAERDLSRRVQELVEYPHSVPPNLDLVLRRVQEAMHLPLSSQQLEAVKTALSHHISVITGPPGTGKTTVLKTLVETAERLSLHYVLCAPTGRAAKRMSEITHREARTIHRLIGWGTEAMSNRANPLRSDLLIVDEVSMVDLQIARDLLEAVDDHCSVVLIGDYDQLPAVDPGAVLKDLINCGRVPVTTLNQVFRQAEGSLIIQNAHRIRQGLPPVFPPPIREGTTTVAKPDSYRINVPRTKAGDDVDWTKGMLVKLLSEKIPQTWGVDPIHDVQVLAPMKQGPGGIYDLNLTLQRAINPEGAQITMGFGRFRVGDRVMQFENNYELDIFNGDIGFVEGADALEEKVLMVNFDGRTVKVPEEQTDKIQLAYAQTIHKAQGSEYPVVVVVLLSRHHQMLDRNLLYTANTRAQKACIYVAAPWALKRAVETAQLRERNSFLGERIKQLLAVEA